MSLHPLPRPWVSPSPLLTRDLEHPRALESLCPLSGRHPLTLSLAVTARSPERGPFTEKCCLRREAKQLPAFAGQPSWSPWAAVSFRFHSLFVHARVQVREGTVQAVRCGKAPCLFERATGSVVPAVPLGRQVLPEVSQRSARGQPCGVCSLPALGLRTSLAGRPHPPSHWDRRRGNASS